MNTLIGIVLLLLFVSGDSQFMGLRGSSDVKKYNPTDMEKRQEVLNLNKDRLEFAKKEQIANMHDVTWDNTLESKIKTMTCDDLVSPASDYVVFGHIYLNILPKDRMKSPLFHPLQTKIACGTLETECNVAEICLMGPKNTEPEPSHFKHGSPGTQCSGLNGVSGLCVGGGGGDVKPKEGGEAVSSASIPMTFLSLALGLIMA